MKYTSFYFCVYLNLFFNPSFCKRRPINLCYNEQDSEMTHFLIHSFSISIKKKLKTMIQPFMIFNNVDMNSTAIAVLILHQAQIVEYNSTFKMVLVSFMLRCLSISFMGISFYYFQAINLKKVLHSSLALKVLWAFFTPTQVVLLFLLNISTFKLNHIFNPVKLQCGYCSLQIILSLRS